MVKVGQCIHGCGAPASWTYLTTHVYLAQKGCHTNCSPQIKGSHGHQSWSRLATILNPSFSPAELPDSRKFCMRRLCTLHKEIGTNEMKFGIEQRVPFECKPHRAYRLQRNHSTRFRGRRGELFSCIGLTDFDTSK